MHLLIQSNDDYIPQQTEDSDWRKTLAFLNKY